MHEALPLGRQRIFHTRRDLGKGRATDQPVERQFFERGAQNLVRHPRQFILEVAIAQCAVRQNLKHTRLPLLGHEPKAKFERTVG